MKNFVIYQLLFKKARYMSIKDDVNYIKNELSSEEKFLESFVKTERFFKKYKKLIVVLIITVIVGSIAFLVKTKLDEKNLYEANIALSSFLENGNQLQHSSSGCGRIGFRPNKTNNQNVLICNHK